MTIYIFLPKGQSVSVEGDFRGVQKFAHKTIGPVIELDSIDNNGNREFFISDPRSYITDGNTALYNPRDFLDQLSDGMREDMEADLTWPLRIIGNERNKQNPHRFNRSKDVED
jgi:hypothetical protein